MLRYTAISILAILFSAGAPGCSADPAQEADTRPVDMARCTAIDLGEASDLMASGDIDDDRMVVVHGIADPRSLVWRDRKTTSVYYITRVMGTEQRLYFLKRLETKEKPVVLSDFKGHLLRWDHLPDGTGDEIARALKTEYGITVESTRSYVVLASSKPSGCH